MNPRKIKDQYISLVFSEIAEISIVAVNFNWWRADAFYGFCLIRRAEKRAGETKAEKCVCSPQARATSENTRDINPLFYSPPYDYLIQILVHCFPTVTAPQFI